MLAGLLNELIVGCSFAGELFTGSQVGGSELPSSWRFTGEESTKPSCSIEDPFSSTRSSGTSAMVLLPLTRFLSVRKFMSWNLLKIIPDLKTSSNSGVILVWLMSDNGVMSPASRADSTPSSRNTGPL